MKPFLTPGGWQDLKCVHWKVCRFIKCVYTSRIECFLTFLNLSLLSTYVSKDVISVSEISAVNLLQGDSYLLAL